MTVKSGTAPAREVRHSVGIGESGTAPATGPRWQYPRGTMAGGGAQAPDAPAPGAAPQGENVNVAAASWGWTGDRGWFQIPADVVEVEVGTRVWRHDSQDSVQVEALPPLPDAQAQGGAQGSWYGWNYRDDRNKDKDGDVPEWDGKSMHRTTYFRKIDLWVATTGVEPRKQGVRLLAKLTGEAFEKMETWKRPLCCTRIVWTDSRSV